MILNEIYKKVQKSDTGFTLHYPFLYSLVLGMECSNVLEFGSGFSTHCMLHALKKTGGVLRSFDVTNSNENKNITRYSKRSKNWIFCHGDSNLIFNDFDHPNYDVILHDGSHVGSEVLTDLENAYPLLKKNGILLLHDTMHPTLGQEMMSAFEDFSKDRNVEFCHLPYGYGLTLIRNQENTTNPIELTWEKKRQ